MLTFWKSRSNRAILAGLFLTVTAFLIANNFFKRPGKGRPLVKPHESTTLFTSPLDSNGDVDYLAIYKEKIRRGGVDPDDNALVYLLKGIGPTPEGRPLGADFYEQLGSTEPRMALFDHFYRWKNSFIATSSLELDPQDLRLHYDFANSNPWTTEQAPSVDAYLIAMKPSLVHFDEAIEKTRFFCPGIQPDPNDPIIGMLLPIAQSLRRVGHLYGLMGMRNIAEGDYDSALANAMKVRKLAKLMSQSSTEVEQLVTAAIENIAIDIEQKAVMSNELSLEKIRAHLDVSESFKNVADSTFAFEVTNPIMFLDLAKRIGRGETTYAEIKLDWGMRSEPGTELREQFAAGSVDWEQVMRRVIRYHDDVLAAKKLVSTHEKIAKLKEIRTALDQEYDDGSVLSSRKARADRFFAYLMKPIGGITVVNSENTFAKIKVRNSQTYIAFALAGFKEKYNQYPKSLDELVPEFVPSVPIDEFSGTVLSYRKTDESFLIYSVGFNQEDDNGACDPRGNVWLNPIGADDILFPPKEQTLEEFMKQAK
jgi:hypothetical protein